MYWNRLQKTVGKNKQYLFSIRLNFLHFRNIKIDGCINDQNAKTCNFQGRELKLFPHNKYLHDEDTGIVLIKLNQSIKGNLLFLVM